MKWLARLRIPLQGQEGSTLIESLIAIAILGTAVVAFVVALSTGSIAIGVAHEQVVAQRLVQAQLEFIRGLDFDPYDPYNPYATTYLPFTTCPDTLQGYVILTGVRSINGGDAEIQKITVTIYRGGEDILTVETYRVRR